MMEAAPRTIKELAKDAWYDRAATESEVYADILDEAGARGNGRGKGVVDGSALTLEQIGGMSLMKWARDKCHQMEAAFVPWLGPLQGMVKSAAQRRKITAPPRSVIALAE